MCAVFFLALRPAPLKKIEIVFFVVLRAFEQPINQSTDGYDD